MVVGPPAAETIFERFEIEFDAGPEPVFHGGELVTGSLKIQLKNEATINSIRLQFRGRAVFLGPSGGKKAPEGQKEKIYFDKDFVLLERPPGHPEPGHFPWNANFLYSLPFECPLPKGCETSYEGPHGFIRYNARAILETDEPNKAQYLVKKAFSIVSPPELHQLVAPQSAPIAEQKTIRYGGCCCRGKMSAEIHLPKSAYAPGENIVGTFTMDARSAKNALEHIEVRLVDKLQRILDRPTSPAPEPTPTIVVESSNNNNAEAKENAEADGKKAKKKKPEKPPKKEPKSPKKQPQQSEPQQPLCQRVVIGRKLAKEDLTTERAKGAQTVTQTNVLFIRVPAVTPTTQIEKEPRSQQHSMLFDDDLLDGGAENGGENGQFHRLLESPSTATLRARKEPFLRVEYALQISLGTQVLLELPIQVHAIPIYAKGIEFRPFAAGAQPIGESDESGLIPFNGPFTFTPQYPMYLESPQPIATEEDGAIAVPHQQTTQVEQMITISPAPDGQVPNGVHEGGRVTTTTVTHVQSEKLLPDGTKVQRKEEIFIETEGPGDGPSAAAVQQMHDTAVNEELQKSTAELGQQPFIIEEQMNTGPRQMVIEEQMNTGPRSIVIEEQMNTGPRSIVIEEQMNTGPRQMVIEEQMNTGPREPFIVEEMMNTGPRQIVIEEQRRENDNVAAEEGPSEPVPSDQPAHSHFEQNEQLPNGHTVHTVMDEWKQANGGDAEIRRVVEEERYEMQNEDGSKVSVQKTTEKISAVETRVEELTNGEDQHTQNDSGNAADESGGTSTNEQSTENQQNLQQNNQMDVSMSG